MKLEQLKFPIGPCAPVKEPGPELVDQWIKEIEAFPTLVEALVKDLSVQELNWRYRPDGWSIKQVVHHCADSHMNSLTRFKLALTEDTPTIRPFFEDRWANLADSLDDDITHSLMILKGLHQKWGLLLWSLTEKQLQLEFIHPEQGRRISLAENIGIYAWHSNHHLAHIKNAIASKGKYG